MYSNLCSDRHTHTNTLRIASSLLQLSSPRQSIGKTVGAALIKLINKWKRCAEWRRQVETVDRVLTEYSQSALTVGPESEYAIATEMVSGIRHQLSPKKKSEGQNWGKLWKLISLRVLHCLLPPPGNCWRLSLIAHGLCQFPRWREIKSLPLGRETAREREGETMQHGLQIEIGQMN